VRTPPSPGKGQPRVVGPPIFDDADTYSLTTAGQTVAAARFALQRKPPGLRPGEHSRTYWDLSSYTKVYSVIHDSGSVPG